jgi:hypothetical protein
MVKHFWILPNSRHDFLTIFLIIMKRRSPYANEDISDPIPSCLMSACDDNLNIFSEGIEKDELTAPDDPDALQINEWNQLSTLEREKVQEEIHGVAGVTQEGKEFVDLCLTELEAEIRLIRKRVAYDRALFLNPTYIGRDFQLMFLRSEYFDARKAARRLVDHFQLKLVLFGIEKLVTDITLDDLPEDALDCMNCGNIQILPAKDRSGRTIVCVAQKYQKYESCSLPEVRAIYYPLMQPSCAMMMEDEVTLTQSSCLEFSLSCKLPGIYACKPWKTLKVSKMAMFSWFTMWTLRSSSFHQNPFQLAHN